MYANVFKSIFLYFFIFIIRGSRCIDVKVGIIYYSHSSLKPLFMALEVIMRLKLYKLRFACIHVLKSEKLCKSFCSGKTQVQLADTKIYFYVSLYIF